MAISSAFSPSRKARGVAQEVVYVNRGAAGTRFRPVRIALVGQGQDGVTYGTTPRQIFSAQDVGIVEGYISPLYIAALSLFPTNGVGVGDIPVTVYPLAQPASGGVKAVGSVTPSGTVSAGKSETHYVKIGNVRSDAIVLVAGDTVAQFISKAISAIAAVSGMPVVASDGTTALTLTCGWEGETGNDVEVETVSPVGAEISLVTVQPTSGAGTVSIAPFTSALGSQWETHVINCLGYLDTTVLAAYEAANEARWAPEVRKPFRVYTGTAEATLATVTAVTEARKTQRTNIICPNPGSKDMPFRIAAEWCKQTAMLASIDPAFDYCLREMGRLSTPAAGSEWSSEKRQAAIIAGCASTDVIDDMVVISDSVTTYHPTGEEPPAYAYDVDIEKLSTVIFNTDLIFMSKEWAGAPLKPDADRVKNPRVKKPKHAKSACFKMFDALGDDAIISDVDYAKENSLFQISSVNPKRLDLRLVFKLSGNTNVISITQEFSYYFGGE